MVSSIWLLAGAISGYGVYTMMHNLRKNIDAARRSGLTYIIVRKLSLWIGTPRTCH